MLITKREEWDVNENWRTLSAKIALFTELESRTSRTLTDALLKQQQEKDSFPEDTEGEL